MQQCLKDRVVESLEELRDRLQYISTKEKKKNREASGSDFAMKARNVEELIREVRLAH